MSNVFNKSKLKDILVKRISDDEAFKKEFVRNPQVAIGSLLERDILQNIKIETDRENSGILHVKISDINSQEPKEEKDYIHLIMLDHTS